MTTSLLSTHLLGTGETGRTGSDWHHTAMIVKRCQQVWVTNKMQELSIRYWYLATAGRKGSSLVCASALAPQIVVKEKEKKRKGRCFWLLVHQM